MDQQSQQQHGKPRCAQCRQRAAAHEQPQYAEHDERGLPEHVRHADHGRGRAHADAAAVQVHDLKRLPAGGQRRYGGIEKAEHGRNQAVAKRLCAAEYARDDLVLCRVAQVVQRHAHEDHRRPAGQHRAQTRAHLFGVQLDGREDRQRRRAEQQQDHDEDLFFSRFHNSILCRRWISYESIIA